MIDEAAARDAIPREIPLTTPHTTQPGSWLDIIGVTEGTDKSSILNDYLASYEEMLGRYRYAEINVIEIGVLGGKSLKVWKQFFARAAIVGIDIVEACRKFADDRVTIEIGSQADPEFLSGVCAKHPPTVVIDDGSHKPEHILCSFRSIFPALLPGGMYVIEDMQMCGDISNMPDTPFDLVGGMVRSLMSRKGNWSGEIDSVTVIRGAAFIRKSDPAEEMRELDATEALIRNGGDAQVWHLFAIKLMSRRPPLLERAEAAIRHAIEANPLNPASHWHESQILARLGKLDAAMYSAEKAIQLGEGAPLLPKYIDQRQHVLKLLAARGRG